MKNVQKFALGIAAAASVAGTAQAANVAISTDIGTSTTWTADNVYNLVGQIFVLPGATLTIEPGTVIASVPAQQGSLAISRGAKIIANGTADKPIIMTSTNDDFTNWREAANEWGNLTIMGNGLISASNATNSNGVLNGSTPDGTAESQMEGLTSAVNTFYGGNDDNDDSGSLSYVSIRYAGKVVALTKELNGLSLGAIGRATDIHHVEIMNNVDDGIEIWGGTVNLKYFSIWNVGDDSLDIDQGWRGKAQFGLIVQGYSRNASQGSGVGDNCIETDGAEDSDAQPVTTGVVYNCTVIGQPGDVNDGGDGATAWRDGARMQYHNCVFMDIGDELVRADGDDGDGQSGYGHNGTLSFADVWTTPYTATSTVNAAAGANPGDFNHPATLYTTQAKGNLAQITDSVVYNINDLADANANGVFAAANNNVQAASSPIAGITRAATVTRGGKDMQRVTSLDPRAANDAVTSVDVAPLDGFFVPAPFRGAFSTDVNWLAGWTAADEYGMTVTSGAPANPAATIGLTAATSFQTVAGVIYTVECSDDMVNWSPVGTVVGTGGGMTVADSLNTFDNAKFYRAIAQ